MGCARPRSRRRYDATVALANGSGPRVSLLLLALPVFPHSRCFPRAFVRESSMHRACRLTLFFRFNSHRDYSNRVPRVVSLALPKRGDTSPTLHPTILPSLRPNQFVIFLNRTFSPRDTVSRDFRLDRCPIDVSRHFPIFRVTLALIRSIPKLQRDRHRGISIPARFSLTLESVDISAS